MHDIAYHHWSKKDILPKLARYVYDLNTFSSLLKTEGATQRAAGKTKKKIIKTFQEFINILILI